MCRASQPCRAQTCGDAEGSSRTPVSAEGTGPCSGSTSACSWLMDVLPVQASLQGEYQRSMAAQEGEAQHAVTQEELQQRAEAVKARLPE